MRHLTVTARVVLGILLVFLVSCGSGHDADEKYYLISNQYQDSVLAGGRGGVVPGRRATQGAFRIRRS